MQLAEGRGQLAMGKCKTLKFEETLKHWRVAPLLWRGGGEFFLPTVVP